MLPFERINFLHFTYQYTHTHYYMPSVHTELCMSTFGMSLCNTTENEGTYLLMSKKFVICLEK